MTLTRSIEQIYLELDSHSFDVVSDDDDDAAAGKMGPSPVKDDYIDKITLAESLQKRYCFETTS
ncbi:hypothetical protein BLOT_003206 [Blomia tropicalis]|nr:hypothetical protein BLOT_003206 [Blomia tropicalis]